jgi:hypothetical protein
MIVMVTFGDGYGKKKSMAITVIMKFKKPISTSGFKRMMSDIINASPYRNMAIMTML